MATVDRAPVAGDARTQTERLGFLAYMPGFLGGVRVALGDFTGDGIPDIVTGAGPGGAPHVQVFDGSTGTPLPGALGSLLAFASTFTGGVTVAAGDVRCTGSADIVAGVGAGGEPGVRAFRGQDAGLALDFLAYDPAFPGEVRVATGDLDGDGCAEIVTELAPGGAPHVRIFDGRTGAPLSGFFAYAPAFLGGVFVATGDVDGDGRDDIITGAGTGGGPHVEVFSGLDGSLIRSFLAFDPGFTGGVRVGAVDLDGDGHADIVVAAGPGGGPEVRVFSGADGTLLWDFFAYDPGFRGGVFVGGSR